MLINGSAHAIPLLDKSVHCICTSSPYFALRRYSGDQGIDWPSVTYCPYPSLGPITIPAMKASLGLEPNPESFIGHLILIWRELHRVLRDDGVCWAVIGDSYMGSWGNYGNRPELDGKSLEQREKNVEYWGRGGWDTRRDRPASSYYPSGNLFMIPHRFALALQGDGWLIRNDVVWRKTNPMPESVRGPRWERHRIKVKKGDGSPRGPGLASRAQHEAYFEQGEEIPKYVDCLGCPKCEKNNGLILKKGSWRHTRAHEYIIMAVKKMGYWSNQEIVKEPLAKASVGRARRYQKAMKRYGSPEKPSSKHLADGVEQSSAYAGMASGRSADPYGKSRNPRSVLTTSTANYKGAHYATFPTRLVRSLIKSSTPLRCCPACGKGWSPIVNRGVRTVNKTEGQAQQERCGGTITGGTERVTLGKTHLNTQSIIGYRPTCNCAPKEMSIEELEDFLPTPGIVFDPFIGSGTVGEVAIEEGLNWIGLDLSFDYLNEHAKVRTNNIQLRLGEFYGTTD